MKNTVLGVLYDAGTKIEKEIMKTESLVEDLQWDLESNQRRLEFLNEQLKDIKEHIEKNKQV